MSSVGQLVGGVVGGVVGFFVGGPSGAYYGAQAGIMIGGAIDPPDGPVINGPRLDDLSVQTSTYGAFIPRNYGTIAQTGNVFWLKGDALTETARAEESGGKGGPTTTTNLWDYSATFALGLCEGPIDGIRRIWINGQLFYDAGSDDTGTIIASNEAAGLFTLYLGTDTQLPDPLMQADKGIANVPAYRGLAYIVFDNLPLAKYNNSLAGAQIKVEIAKAMTTHTILSAGGTVTTSGAPRTVIANKNYVYVTCTTTNDLQVFNIANPSFPILESTTDTGVHPGFIAISGSHLYVVNVTSETLQIFNIGSPSYPILVGSIATGDEPRAVAIIGGYAYVATKGPTNDGIQVFNIGIPSNPTFIGFVSATANPENMVSSGSYLYLTSLTSNLLQVFDASEPVPVFVSSISTAANPYGLAVVGDYAYVASYSGNKLEIFDISNPAAIVAVGNITVAGNPISVVVDGEYAYVAKQSLNKVDVIKVSNKALPTLEWTVTTGSAPVGVDYANAYFWVVNVSGNSLQSFFFSGDIITPTSATPLSEIVQEECLTSSLLSASDLDVTELTDSVRGYRIASLGALRGGIEPLRVAWPFDVVQHGYKIKFKRRGSASVVTINADELDARAAGESPGVQITNSREMDTLLPSNLRLNYIDSVREYDTNQQISDRGL